MEQANDHKPQLIIERWASPTHAVVEITYPAVSRCRRTSHPMSYLRIREIRISYIRQDEDDFALTSMEQAFSIEMELFKNLTQPMVCTIDL